VCVLEYSLRMQNNEEELIHVATTILIFTMMLQYFYSYQIVMKVRMCK